MQYPHGTTIAVTDGQKLRIFRNFGDELHLRLVEQAQPDVHAHNKGVPHNHHLGEPNPTERRLQEEFFSAAVATWLNQQVLAGHIQQLFIVAPARTLGALRPHYHQALVGKLIGELGKEHTHDSVEHLHDALVNVK